MSRSVYSTALARVTDNVKLWLAAINFESNQPQPANEERVLSLYRRALGLDQSDSRAASPSPPASSAVSAQDAAHADVKPSEGNIDARHTTSAGAARNTVALGAGLCDVGDKELLFRLYMDFLADRGSSLKAFRHAQEQYRQFQMLTQACASFLSF